MNLRANSRSEMKITPYILAFCYLICISCAVRPVGTFNADAVPPSPDYTDPDTWAALPFRSDSADLVPDLALRNNQETAEVDVFYLYPTTYTGKRGQKSWNADVRDESLNIRTDRTAIRNQATVFNGSCKVYAPRYRQAHLESFYTVRHKEDARKALNLAYLDVRASFEYYLRNYNHGRPLIIASHSQGTFLALRLIEEFYGQGQEEPDLVAAYLIGMPVEKNAFTTLPPCEAPDEIHCYCSWRTVHEKYRPHRVFPVGDNYAVTNPLTWRDGTEVAPRSLHVGAVLTKFHHGLYPEFLDAWIDDGLLRVSRPKIPGVPFLLTRNYHVADYNFFYANFRQNVEDRVTAYFKSALK